MREVVVNVTVAGNEDLADEAAPDERLEPVHGLLLTAARGGPDDLEVERASDDGGPGQDLATDLVDRRDPPP
jgi:hypothetical protein